MINKTGLNNILFQAIQDMIEKLINSIHQISFPITEKEKEPDQFYNQVFFLMMDKYPKIKTEFKITRNSKGLLIQPKDKKKCDALIKIH